MLHLRIKFMAAAASENGAFLSPKLSCHQLLLSKTVVSDVNFYVSVPSASCSTCASLYIHISDEGASPSIPTCKWTQMFTQP